MKLGLANDSSADVLAKGEIHFSANVLGEVRSFRLKDALHVPDLRTNLLSVGKITDNGFSVTFNKNKTTVNDSEGKTKLTADRINGLYYVRETSKRQNSNIQETVCSSWEIESLETWHRRLGHLNERYRGDQQEISQRH